MSATSTMTSVAAGFSRPINVPDQGGTYTVCAAQDDGGTMDLNLKDKVVIVTGGAAGIGRATAARFRDEGATVVVWDLPDVDVTKADAVNAAAEAVAAKHGRIDVLVNNAGILRDAQ